MGKFESDLRKIERQVATITGNRTGAARFKKELRACFQQAAAQAGPAIADQLVAAGKAGFVNDPRRKGKSVLVEKRTGCLLLAAQRRPFERPRIKHRRTAPVDRTAFLNHLKTPKVGEDFVPHMYLDEDGNVTVGIGTLLEDADEAKSLPFVESGTNTPAHPKHIENAYNKVKAATPGGAASTFKSLTNIDISEADAEKKALTDMDEFIAQLRAKDPFKEFDTFPPTAKMGLLDMAYTLGVKGIRDIFKVFKGAVGRRDWRLAAKESNRLEIPVERNDQVRQWFEQAAKREPFFLHPTCKKKVKPVFQ